MELRGCRLAPIRGGPVCTLGQEIIGVNGHNTWKAAEVFHVECQYVCDSMHHHRSDQPGIVTFLSSYAMADHELAPLWVDRVDFGQPYCGTFDARDDADGQCGKKTETIVFNWPGAHRPALDEILTGSTKCIAAGKVCGEVISRLPMLRMRSMNA